jgi:hypothetical protein
MDQPIIPSFLSLKAMLHGAIFLATCNAILLLRDVKLPNASLHHTPLMFSQHIEHSSLTSPINISLALQVARKIAPCNMAFTPDGSMISLYSMDNVSISHLSLNRLISSLEERSNINFCISLDLSSSSNSSRFSRINSVNSVFVFLVNGFPEERILNSH